MSSLQGIDSTRWPWIALDDNEFPCLQLSMSDNLTSSSLHLQQKTVIEQMCSVQSDDATSDLDFLLKCSKREMKEDLEFC
mmetsp:Transcript_3068/g.8324  ORF Transcript_3068/g.8324 Transcript_3068/m.8324 type:complete len:80 (-) Transcript_3068:2193-2432(-)